MNKTIMKNMQIGAVSLAVAALVTGCGGGGTSSSDEGSAIASTASTPDTGTVTSVQVENIGVGYYKDAAIEGIPYTCGIKSGITQKEGKFIFEIGAQECIFSFGEVLVHRVDGKDLQEGMTVWENNTIVAQILQSIDSDKNLDNGIQISEEMVKRMANLSLDKLPTTVSELEDVLSILTSAGIELVEKDMAMEHLLQQRLPGLTLYAPTGERDDIAPVTFAQDLSSVSIQDPNGEVIELSLTISGDMLLMAPTSFRVKAITEEGLEMIDLSTQEEVLWSFEDRSTGGGDGDVTEDPNAKVYALDWQSVPMAGEVSYVLVMEEKNDGSFRKKVGTLAYGTNDTYSIAFIDGDSCQGKWHTPVNYKDIVNNLPKNPVEGSDCRYYVRDDLNFVMVAEDDVYMHIEGSTSGSSSRGDYSTFSGFSDYGDVTLFGLFVSKKNADYLGTRMEEENELLNGDYDAKEILTSHYGDTGVFVYVPPVEFEYAYPVMFSYDPEGNRGNLAAQEDILQMTEFNRVRLRNGGYSFLYDRFYMHTDVWEGSSIAVTAYDPGMDQFQTGKGKIFDNYEEALAYIKENYDYADWVYSTLEYQKSVLLP